MAQQVLVGLIAAMAVLAASILTLVGVLISTRINFKLGKRTGDLTEQTTLTAQNTAYREEIDKVWAKNQKLRQDSELAATQHETEKEGWAAEKDGWAAEKKTLLAKIEGQLQQLAEKDKLIARAEAERDIALEGQASAEGGLTATRKTIEAMAN